MTKDEYNYIKGDVDIGRIREKCNKHPPVSSLDDIITTGNLLDRLREVGEKAEDAPDNNLSMSRKDVYDFNDLVLRTGPKEDDSKPKTLDDAIRMFLKWRGDFGVSQLNGSVLAFNLINRIINVLRDVQDADKKTCDKWRDAVNDPPTKN